MNQSFTIKGDCAHPQSLFNHYRHSAPWIDTNQTQAITQISKLDFCIQISSVNSINALKLVLFGLTPFSLHVRTFSKSRNQALDHVHSSQSPLVQQIPSTILSFICHSGLQSSIFYQYHQCFFLYSCEKMCCGSAVIKYMLGLHGNLYVIFACIRVPQL